MSGRKKPAFGVYLIENQITGEMYVGSTVASFSQRWSIHRRRLSSGRGNRRLRAAWTQYGEEAFEFIVLETIEDASIVTEREQWWMDVLKPQYNIVPLAGRTTGYKHTEETKRQLSAVCLGRKLTDEHRTKIGLGLLGKQRGKRVSDSAKQKIREARIRQGCPQPVGYKHSEQTRQKMRLAHVGREVTADRRAKQSVAIKAWWKRRKENQIC